MRPGRADKLCAGVREGPRVLGYREADKDTKPVLIDGTVAHMRPGYIPPKRPYGFDDMLSDILEFGVRSLVPDGRLSLWMPTADDEDVELGIPQSPGLELLSVCVQHFNKCMLLEHAMRTIFLMPVQGREDY